MLAEKFKALYNRYIIERHTDQISEKEFERILLMFPAVLVLKSDGQVDTTEMMYLSQLARYMSDQGLNISDADIRQEIRHLAQRAHYWRAPFLEVLRLFITEHKVGGEVVQMMIAAASSSTGNMRQNIQIKLQHGMAAGTDNPTAFISEDEKEAILNVVGELELGADEHVQQQIAAILG